MKGKIAFASHLVAVNGNDISMTIKYCVVEVRLVMRSWSLHLRNERQSYLSRM